MHRDIGEERAHAIPLRGAHLPLPMFILPPAAVYRFAQWVLYTFKLMSSTAQGARGPNGGTGAKTLEERASQVQKLKNELDRARFGYRKAAEREVCSWKGFGTALCAKIRKCSGSALGSKTLTPQS